MTSHGRGTNERTNERRANERTSERVDGRTDGRTGGWTDGRTAWHDAGGERPRGPSSIHHDDHKERDRRRKKERKRDAVTRAREKFHDTASSSVVVCNVSLAFPWKEGDLLPPSLPRPRRRSSLLPSRFSSRYAPVTGRPAAIRARGGRFNRICIVNIAKNLRRSSRVRDYQSGTVRFVPATLSRVNRSADKSSIKSRRVRELVIGERRRRRR